MSSKLFFHQEQLFFQHQQLFFLPAADYFLITAAEFLRVTDEEQTCIGTAIQKLRLQTFDMGIIYKHRSVFLHEI